MIKKKRKSNTKSQNICWELNDFYIRYYKISGMGIILITIYLCVFFILFAPAEASLLIPLILIGAIGGFVVFVLSETFPPKYIGLTESSLILKYLTTEKYISWKDIKTFGKQKNLLTLKRRNGKVKSYNLSPNLIECIILYFEDLKNIEDDM